MSIQQPESLCHYQQLSSKCFVGLELRTNNRECPLAMPQHKERFFREDIAANISNKVSDDTLALYTDYERDYHGEYSWILGCEVSSLKEVPAGLVGKVIPAARYAVFMTQGPFPQGLVAVWEAVWKSNLARSYTHDFEIYSADFNPSTNPKVTVCIGVASL